MKRYPNAIPHGKMRVRSLIQFLNIDNSDIRLCRFARNKILRRRDQHHKTVLAISHFIPVCVCFLNGNMLHFADNHCRNAGAA